MNLVWLTSQRNRLNNFKNSKLHFKGNLEQGKKLRRLSCHKVELSLSSKLSASHTTMIFGSITQQLRNNHQLLTLQELLKYTRGLSRTHLQQHKTKGCGRGTFTFTLIGLYSLRRTEMMHKLFTTKFLRKSLTTNLHSQRFGSSSPCTI